MEADNVWAGMDRTLMAFEDNHTRYPAQSAIVNAGDITIRLVDLDNKYSLEDLIVAVAVPLPQLHVYPSRWRKMAQRRRWR
jgi:hypothetical protein